MCPAPVHDETFALHGDRPSALPYVQAEALTVREVAMMLDSTRWDAAESVEHQLVL